MLKASSSEQALSTAAALDAAGEPDAAAYLRKETLRRVTTVAELEVVRRIVMRDEPDVDDELDKAYQKAKADEERLLIVRRFLRIAPHSALGRRRLFALLETLGRKEALVREIERARTDPFADAGLLASGASALRRLGFDQEGRRAFGELIERAPGDPWTLGYVGDRLRGESLFDEATAAYESLNRALPDDPAVLLRLGLAHAGAGRLDVATRLLDRVAQTGGRGDDGRMGELASMTEAVLLAGARAAAPGPDLDAQLVRRLVQTPLPDVASVVVVRSPPGDEPVVVRVVRDASAKDEDAADLDASEMGLAAVRIERGQVGARIRLRRSAANDTGRPTHATVAVLVLADDRGASRLVTREVDIRERDGVELKWDGEKLL
jgi:tetratricopeptide (TPR) repeat protein